MLSWRAPRINLSPGQTNQLKILSENLSIESGQNKIDRERERERERERGARK